MTGEIHHVDSGYHVVGMKAVDAPDIDGGQGVTPSCAQIARPRFDATIVFLRHGETDWNAE